MCFSLKLSFFSFAFACSSFDTFKELVQYSDLFPIANPVVTIPTAHTAVVPFKTVFLGCDITFIYIVDNNGLAVVNRPAFIGHINHIILKEVVSKVVVRYIHPSLRQIVLHIVGITKHGIKVHTAVRSHIQVVGA